MSGVDRIAVERQRQIDAEGWTPAHDAEHARNALVLAAICYATPPEQRVIRTRNMSASFSIPDRGDRYARYPAGWPWSPDDWKPADRLRELEKAGALIAAEIDRLLLERAS